MKFNLLHTDSGSKARAGILHTAHGDIETPIFMPVGTVGSVKAVQMPELKSDIKERLVDLYGTEVYETIKRVILSEYRKFGVTSEEIDRIARSLR